MSEIIEKKLPEKIKVLSADKLKIIALCIMLIDHIDLSLIKPFIKMYSADMSASMLATTTNVYNVLDKAGRVAFPIFCFFLVEGFLRTKSVIKYALRLFVFALISEIPFDLAIFKSMYYPEHQNVLFTMFLGLLCLCTIKYIQSLVGLSTPFNLFLQFSAIAGFCELASLLKTDYSFKGILLISILYLFAEYKEIRLLAGAAAISWEQFAPIGFLLLYFYDSSKKPKLKYLFYIFYPAHLFLLYLISLATGLYV